jgi:hypothetical protein
MPFRVFILLFCLLAGAAIPFEGLFAQVKLTAIPSKTVVEENEVFQLQFVLEGGMQTDEFVPPSFRQVEVKGNVVQTNGWTWINGSLTEYVSYTYQLRALQKGKLYFASAIAKVKGKLLTSKPFSIVVTEPALNSSSATASLTEEKPDYFLAPGEDAKEKIKKNLFVKLLIDKKTCYAGEPITASFKLYTRLESESKIVKRPSFNGFSVMDAEEPESGLFYKEMIDGKWYNCYLIRKVQLIPLQAGDLQIEPVEIENRVKLIRLEPSAKIKNNWLESLLEKIRKSEITAENIVDEKLSVFSPSQTIHVVELPEENKPQNFSGAVGDYTIEAQLEKNELPEGESGVFKIKLSGTGNIGMITSPAVNWPAGIEAFDARVTEEFEKNTTPLKGMKWFEIPFTGVKGSYRIPPVEFTYFDAALKSYKVLRTDSLQLTITDALPAPVSKIETPVMEEEMQTNNSLHYIVIAAGGAFLLLIGFVLFFVFRKKQRPTKQAVVLPVKMELAEEKRPVPDFLRQAKQARHSTHHKQFYLLLLDALQRYFADRLNLTPTSANRQLLVDYLKQNKLDAIAGRYQELAQQCEFIVFSPVEADESKDDFLNHAEELMQEAEKVLG